MHDICLVGAHGLVGKELEMLCRDSPFRLKKLGREDPMDFSESELVFLATDAVSAKDLAQKALLQGKTVIDLSSAHRKEPGVPLVIPEINGHLLASRPKLIASPNCTASIMLMVLAPLHRAFTIKRIQASTYQASSGAGKKGLEELLENRPPSVFPHPYQYNVFLHESPLHEDGYCEEEEKVIFETRKILNEETLAINVRCVRVPVKRAHSIAVNVTFENNPSHVLDVLKDAPGIAFHLNPTPLAAEGHHPIYYAPPRLDQSQTNTLDLWIVGDQLLKGAALNAFQIAEFLLNTKSLK